MKNFLIKDAAIADHFAYEFRTLIYISKRGVYRFYTISDDGSKLYIDDKLIVDNDGGHSVRRAEGKVALEKGYHALHLLYFENYMGQELEVGFLGRDIPETPIPAEMLFLPDQNFFLRTGWCRSSYNPGMEHLFENRYFAFFMPLNNKKSMTSFFNVLSTITAISFRL